MSIAVQYESESLCFPATAPTKEDYIDRLYAKHPWLERLERSPLASVVDYYADRLSESPQAIAFLQDKLELDIDTAIDLKAGFSDRSLGNLLPEKTVIHGKSIRNRLQELGVYKANGREAMRGYVTIPLRDSSGDVTGIYGRAIQKRPVNDLPLIIGEGFLPDSIAKLLNVYGWLQAGHPPTEPTCSESLEPIEQDHQSITPAEITLVAFDIPTDSNETLAVKPNGTVDEISCNAIECSSPSVTESTATSEPIAKITDHDISIESHQVTLRRGDRVYRVQGLERNQSSLTLLVQLQASRHDLLHLDTLDLVKAKSRTAFIRAAASELFVDEDIVKRDVGVLLLQLEDLRNRQIELRKLPEQSPAATMTSDERQRALDWLRSPNLTDRIISDLQECGMVGESTNKLVAYLACVSRKLDNPLAILVQSSSSAGKSTLMDSVLAMMPAEEQLRLSNLSGQSLYYLDPHALEHKTLAISEDHGIVQAAYALKILQSEGRLAHATVAKGKDGRMAMQTYCVNGPAQLFLTTTGVQIDEELVNRCLVLTVDESREQTQAIQNRQRLLHTRDGQSLRNQSESIVRCHHNAQRLLRPLRVYNPYATKLSFASDKTRLRRDHGKYLTMIQAIALLHQYQRPIQIDLDSSGNAIESIEVIPSDITLANRLMGEIFGRSLDELSPQTRRCLQLCQTFVLAACREQAIDVRDFRFTRRAFRESIQWSDFQIRMHFEKLVQMEYLLVHHGRQGRSFVYELLYDCPVADSPLQQAPQLPGLSEV